jgi:hypothetical protein
MSTSPPPPYRKGSSSASSAQCQDSLGPQRRETNHLTPDHRPRSTSPRSNVSHTDRSRTSRSDQRRWKGSDPRSSSMQSLRPIETAGARRRTLLLIYIHGFLGNEASFRSFPAHVHNLLTVTLSESHVVHSKIYPRYKSRKPIEYARDDFSNWCASHFSASFMRVADAVTG